MAATGILQALRRRVATAGLDAPQRSTAPKAAAFAPWLVVAGAALCAASVVVAASGASSDAAFGRGLLQLLIVGVPTGVGIYALRTSRNTRFGIALLGVGFLWSLTAWAESSSSLPHSIGRLATWMVFPCVIYLLLAFPHGRIHAGLDRAVWLGFAGVLLFLFFGTAPLVETFPTKTLWSSCVTDCPQNAFFVLDRQPAFLPDLIRVREWLVQVLWLGLFVSMFRRWRAASPLQRPAMGPAFIAGALLGVAHYLHITARQLGASADLVIAFSSAWTFCIVAVCTAFLFGLVWRRMLLANALARLGVALQVSDEPAHVQAALATALSDSTTRLVVRDRASGAWHDVDGHTVDWPPELQPRQAVTTIGTGDAVLIHDVALRDDPELLAGVSGSVLAAWRHQHLLRELGTVAGDLERARLARDLHDGVQQRLTALGIRLSLAQEQIRDDPVAASVRVQDLGDEVELAIDELRSLTDGIHPSTLTDVGLPDALRALTWPASARISVVADHVTRHPMNVENAIYFVCREAVQNALKHSAGAASVQITIRQTAQALSFEIRDDGPGFASGTAGGRGLRNMRYRIEAIGGGLVVDSRPGRGTCVRGSLELAH